MKVVIAGGSGLIGRRLTQHLESQGAEVIWLSRNSCTSRSAIWNPNCGEIDAEAIEGSDAIVNLAGAGITDRRWSKKRKKLILDSRTMSTRLLVDAIGRMRNKPNVLINASGVGYYALNQNKPCDETGPTGDHFLSEVCRAWEAAARPAIQHGVRLAIIRVSLVLDSRGGALPKMLKPFHLGLGGPLGTGQQLTSWIHYEDLVSLLYQAIKNDTYSGTINAVAPNPISNADFGSAVGRTINRPSAIRTPAIAMQLLFGEMADLTLLADLGVTSSRLTELGFQWKYPDLNSALRNLLVKSAG